MLSPAPLIDWALRNYNVDGQIGLESTFQEFIDKLCNIFDEAKRVLKKEGTCFVNIGDTYMGNSSYSEKGRQGLGNDKIGMINKKQWLDPKYPHKEKLRAREHVFSGQVIEKSLCQIPSRFGIEMTDRGWILRNSLVWIKPNAMPESVQDRWKKAHEYIFFFVKSKKYNFNLDAIRTPHKQISIKRAEYEIGRNALGLNPSNTGEKYNRDKKNKDGTEKYYSMPARQVKLNPKGAIPPDYLSINTSCSKQDTVEGHWATFPQSLIIPLIKAGCPEGGIVLDMFSGSATTALVAEKLNKKWIMIDLSPEYCKIGQERMDNFIKQKRLF